MRAELLPGSEIVFFSTQVAAPVSASLDIAAVQSTSLI